MLLAGDIGGTNARLALFDAPPPAEPLELEVFPSGDHEGLPQLLDRFLRGRSVVRASFGIAGPVSGGRADGVNLAWGVDAAAISEHLGLASTGLLNDLEANAWGISALGSDDLAVINAGTPVDGGNAAVISAGTGLGEAGLVWDGTRYVPFASEGGHADFAPISDLQMRLWRFLGGADVHVSVEAVCSGGGLLNIYDFFLAEEEADPSPEVAEARSSGHGPRAISESALRGTDPVAARALDLMVEIYGAEAGNLALTVMATAGVYVGGGIAPQILPAIESGTFMRAFRHKGRLSELLDAVPVRVILNELTALYGAALHAASREPTRLR